MALADFCCYLLSNKGFGNKSAVCIVASGCVRDWTDPSAATVCAWGFWHAVHAALDLCEEVIKLLLRLMFTFL